MKETATQVWFMNPNELLDISKLYDFYPTDTMNYSAKLNSFMRFTVYFSIIIYLLKKTTKVFYSIFFGGVLTFILYRFKKEIFQEEKEDFEDHQNMKCTSPDENNPFMNVLVSDYHTNPNRKEACDVDEDKVKDKMEKNFYKNLYRGVDEVFENNYSYRQFYTTPNTTIPNDQEGFAKWLYFNEDKTLKESHF